MTHYLHQRVTCEQCNCVASATWSVQHYMECSSSRMGAQHSVFKTNLSWAEHGSAIHRELVFILIEYKASF